MMAVWMGVVSDHHLTLLSIYMLKDGEGEERALVRGHHCEAQIALWFHIMYQFVPHLTVGKMLTAHLFLPTGKCAPDKLHSHHKNTTLQAYNYTCTYTYSYADVSMSSNEYVSCLVTVVEWFLCESGRCQEGVHKHLLARAGSDGSLWPLLDWTSLGDRKLQVERWSGKE